MSAWPIERSMEHDGRMDGWMVLIYVFHVLINVKFILLSPQLFPFSLFLYIFLCVCLSPSHSLLLFWLTRTSPSVWMTSASLCWCARCLCHPAPHPGAQFHVGISARMVGMRGTGGCLSQPQSWLTWVTARRCVPREASHRGRLVFSVFCKCTAVS